MKTIYVVDTNVILENPYFFRDFKNTNFIIPFCVLEELDKFKKDAAGIGFHARESLRYLDNLRTRKDIARGAIVHNGCKVAIVDDSSIRNKSVGKDKFYCDNILLALVQDLNETANTHDIRLLTKDINLRVKAAALSIESDDYKTETLVVKGDDFSIPTIHCSKDTIDRIFKSNDEAELNKELNSLTKPFHLSKNYFRFVYENGTSQTAIVRRCQVGANFKIVRFNHNFNFSPKNLEQICALDALLDPSKLLVTLTGPAGTGKTLLALYAGLYQVFHSGCYHKITATRPVISMGKEVGFLPGNLEDKLSPWMQPIFDNIEFLYQSTKGMDLPNFQTLRQDDLLSIEALSYIRGRTLPNQYFIIDEAQNLTPHELKTIITRAGNNTKIVLTGDPEQIDHPYLDSHSNGLSYVNRKFSGSPLFSGVSLVKGERSILANEAINRL